MSSVKKYGWIPDLPSPLDHIYRADKPIDLPRMVDLRPRPLQSVYDQGALGSCTGNAIAAAIQYIDPARFDHDAPSRLFIYYCERDLEGSISEDAGAQIRDGIKCVNTFGVCQESLWPYDISRFTEKPSPDAYAEAEKNQSVKYERIEASLYAMKHCLASGLPFVFGATLFDSFESPEVAKSGIIPVPGAESLVGGHALSCFGYDDEKEWFFVRNSWGNDWGDNGYCYFPYEYLSSPNLCDDRWAIDLME